MFSLTRSVGTRNLVVYVIIVGYSDYISLNVRLDSPNVVTARHRTKISKENNFCLRFGGYFSHRHSYKYLHTYHSPSILDCQAFCSVVLIGSPTPLSRKRVLLSSPVWILWGDTLACGGRGGGTQFGRLARNSGDLYSVQ